MKLPERCCGTCKHYTGTPVYSKHKTPRLLRVDNAECEWPQPVLVYPESITRYIGFSKRLGRSYQHPDGGQTCPCWEKREVAW